MNVLVGVAGGVAAYKAAELVRALQNRGVDVQVAMTRSAEEFIRPLTFAALTGHQVFTSLWKPSAEATSGEAGPFSIEHIAVAQQIDALVIAPATANTIARLAHGLADDFLTTLALATTAPILLAPAMNVNMWNHPATQANLRTLESRGVQIVPTGSGYLACGMTGGGRLADPEVIAEAVLQRLLKTKDLTNEHILITAGGTREPIDPVRFLGNRSSGKMGHALAEEAAARGAAVTLVTASTLAAPAGCTVVRVETARQMMHAVLDHLPATTIIIGAAAVADFRVAEVAGSKIRRNGPLTLELEPTEDIIARVVAGRSANTLVVAFAAETDSPEQNGRAKLLRKGADAIVINDVSLPGLGFDSDSNAGIFLTPTVSVPLPESSKRLMAARILDQTVALRTCSLEPVL
ncbi:bifunctional phosphopantothenoylcysteine decarboxylase/phosphopantothenate--cysteine ligase CoaBC [Granulicella sp. WH15]|uniref:bifunctional phosphopantothenoylcysteine decarboxylase/phosphopantothenate--cysteine ligase CoaBC n=1 Tax=Granulicella sp. WH15 TaxID=2602070 RepID=UPI00136744B1|nr:bifunctional phosphopantothenoylcysteine decarboxylase/phosphopantothenate--cysteine ligase CoaBC [Granulicella sp. WH15]QHN02545.1 bifunctional phosphopantothenoylcysteine decarboxylase/phosphopantothenate--cysteine ligase CoaBC [Granulicella sp. WH15]